jgi:hypothetical protein
MNDWLKLDDVEPATLRDLAQIFEAEFLDGLLQFAIAALSLAAMVMIASAGPLHKWGFVVGLVSQPFWILATWRARQWGMLALSIVYIFVWIFGIGSRFA